MRIAKDIEIVICTNIGQCRSTPDVVDETQKLIESVCL